MQMELENSASSSVQLQDPRTDVALLS